MNNTYYAGWTKEVSRLERTLNLVNSITAILSDNPGNAYWTARLMAETAHLMLYLNPPALRTPAELALVGVAS